MCERVIVFAPFRALGIRHYYLRELMGNSVNIDRTRGRERKRKMRKRYESGGGWELII